MIEISVSNHVENVCMDYFYYGKMKFESAQIIKSVRCSTISGQSLDLFQN